MWPTTNSALQESDSDESSDTSSNGNGNEDEQEYDYEQEQDYEDEHEYEYEKEDTDEEVEDRNHVSLTVNVQSSPRTRTRIPRPSSPRRRSSRIYTLEREDSLKSPMSPSDRRRAEWGDSLENMKTTLISPLPTGWTKLGKRALFTDEEKEEDALHGQLNVQPATESTVRGSIIDRSLGLLREEPGRASFSAEVPEQPRQYNLSSKRTSNSVLNNMLRTIGVQAGEGGTYNSDSTTLGRFGCCNFQPSARVSVYLHWAFRTSFLLYVLSAVLMFYCFTVCFALIIYTVGRKTPECITVGGNNFGQGSTTFGSDFLDAYSLSWTTFSTVGYGLISPSTSTNFAGHTACIGIQIFTTLESFIGILFASFVGAIVFSKITRVSSQAQVEFSDILVIRYGKGVIELGDNDESDSSSDDSTKDKKIVIGPVTSTAKQMDATKVATATKDVTSKGITNVLQEAKMSTTAIRKRMTAIKKKNGKRPVHNIPCPFLEFRLANNLHEVPKGEIMDCQLQVQASIDAKNANADVQRMVASNSRQKRRKGKQKRIQRKERKTHSKKRDDMDENTNTTATESLSEDSKGLSGNNVNCFGTQLVKIREPLADQRISSLTRPPSDSSSFQESAGASSLLAGSTEARREAETPSILERGLQTARHSAIIDEDPGGYLITKKVFSKMLIDSPEHPFFKRVWFVRHQLNQWSPLLTPEARQRVCKNGGFWPKDLNNHESVRASVQFDQVLVSLSGTSNVDANPVYAQKIYYFSDISVGYRFSNMLFQKDDGRLMVDTNLLNGVVEQKGGGGENLPEQDFHGGRSTRNHAHEMEVL